MIDVIMVNGKELSVVIHTVKHNYINFIIVIMRVLTTTCFGPTCGPHVGQKHVVVRTRIVTITEVI